MGKKNNQTFVQILFHKLAVAIENKCVKEGIQFLKQGGSYISKATLLDKDPIPVWSEDDRTHYCLSSKRRNRGLYRSKSGTCIHADINGALNTLERSRVVELDDNLKVNMPILLEVQKRKAVASRIAWWVRQPSTCTRSIGTCSTRRIYLSNGFFHKEESPFFERVVQVGR
ncbi:hypothetical protein IIE_05286 [Bacillus cereus VD045]|nr:hypothetical protein IIE_05286 [Bacillus cereus VD045]